MEMFKEGGDPRNERVEPRTGPPVRQEEVQCG